LLLLLLLLQKVLNDGVLLRKCCNVSVLRKECCKELRLLHGQNRVQLHELLTQVVVLLLLLHEMHCQLLLWH
jgi:hypothetical protein